MAFGSGLGMGMMDFVMYCLLGAFQCIYIESNWCTLGAVLCGTVDLDRIPGIT